MTELKLLAQSNIFHDLDPRMLDRMLEDGERRELIDGDIIFRADQHYTGEIYIIIDGEVVIQRSNGQAYSLGTGDFVGLSSFLDNAPYSSTSFCKGKCDLLVLNDNTFQEVKDDFPGLSTAVNRSIADRIRRWNPGRRGTTGVLIQPVRSFMTVPFAACDAGASVESALNIMRSRKIGSLGVTDDEGHLLGLVTPTSIAEAVVLKDVDPQLSLSEIGVEDAFTLSPDDQLWEAEQMQQDHGIKYLVVVEDGAPVGMVSQTDIVRALCMQAQRNILIGRASEAASMEELKDLFDRLDECASGALEYNRRAANALRILSETHLAILRRCVELTVEALENEGKPRPSVKFAVLIMGSGGRKEMMLEPDQDNGIILADDAQTRDEKNVEWFKLFSERMNESMDAIGYPLCPGDIMARNPMFHKTLSEWKEQISHLADHPTEKAARWSNVVFDFDTLYGDDSLTVSLRKHVHDLLSDNQLLLSFMVEDDAEGRPPIGIFNRLITSDEAGSKGRIDVKRNGLRIIADAARIYALSRGINACNTHDRINALVRLGVIDADFADSVLSAYEELITMVLDHQLEQNRRGEEPDKLINPDEMSPHMREVLRDSMLAVKRFQEKLQGEFARMNF